MELVNAVIEYHKKNGHYPPRYSADENIKNIGTCIFQLREEYHNLRQKEEKYDEFAKILSDYDPEWFISTSYELGVYNANKLIKFYKEHDRYPSKYSKDIVEKKLNIWYLRQRQLKRKQLGNDTATVQGKLYPEVEKILSEDNPEWYK